MPLSPAVRRLSRPAFAAAALAGLCLTGCGTPAPPPEPADLVLTGGSIVTVDPELPRAEAMAARGPWIVAVGSAEEIEPLVGPDTEVVDLAGRTAIPGMIEGHGHFLSLGSALTILDLTTATSWQEIVEMAAAAASRAEPGEWILGRGWHQEKWSAPPDPAVEGAPTHAALSAATPENPVLLTHASGHAAFANALALELAGFDRDAEPPPGGELVRDAGGELTGLLRETAQRPARAAYERSREGRSEEEVLAEIRRYVELAGERALARGVTSFHDAGTGFDAIEALARLEAEGALPVRLYVMVRGASNEEMARRLPEFRSEAEGDDYLVVRSIKRQIDGALGSHGAWLLEPYEDLPSSTGLVLETVDDIRRTVELALEHGYQVATHAIGDRANREVLDLYEEAFAAASGEDLRFRIEHAQHVHPDDLPRFAELGVIASVQAVHCTSDGPWVPKRIGDERAALGAYRWRELLESGAVVINGTDVPVEPIDPIANFYSSVTRRMADGSAFYPGQAMTRAEALRSLTADAAYAAFEEDLKGTLTPGKLADIVVLSNDLMTVPEAEIRNTEVDLTIVGGVVRHRR